jgi:hypothetical protein
MKTKTLKTVIAFFCGTVILLTACKKNNSESAISSANLQSNTISALKKYVPNFTLAKTNSELKQVQNDPNSNIIRSLSQFDKIAAEYNTPLSKLSLTQLQQFRTDLTVRESIAVVGINTEAIAKYLSYDDFAEVLTMFGLDVKQGFWGLSHDPLIIQKLALPTLKTNGVGGGDGDDDGDGTGISGGTDKLNYRCASTPQGYVCQSAYGFICLAGCGS